ncbi:26S proteasome non-ATPase regulatory subunit 7-like protein A, partial [Dichanthelium oligosanthes]
MPPGLAQPFDPPGLTEKRGRIPGAALGRRREGEGEDRPGGGLREHVVGWYSTGPKLRENDLDVHALFNRKVRYIDQRIIFSVVKITSVSLVTGYVPNPILVIIDVQPKELGVPVKAYYVVEKNPTQKNQKVFVHVPSEITADEAEEIGVKDLLRDVKDTSIVKVTRKLAALERLDARLREIRSYLDLVIEEKLPLNHEILYHLQ